MTTRRIVKTEKDILKEDDTSGSSHAVVGSPTKSSTVPRSIIVKLLMFTLAMIVAPLGSYYITLNTIFKDRSGSNTLAGATAAVVANIVLIAYVIVAVNEDDTDEKAHETKSQ